MSLTFKMRQNGRPLATFSVKFTVGGWELARLLAARGDVPEVLAEPPEPGKTMTRTEVEELLRGYAYRYGESSYGSEDDFDPESSYTPAERWAIASWAAGEVRRLWPELAGDPELRTWENEYRPKDDGGTKK